MSHCDADFKANYEVKHGIYNYLDRLVGDIDEISKIDAQIESFKRSLNFLIV